MGNIYFMVQNLAVGSLLVVVCVLIHTGGLILIAAVTPSGQASIHHTARSLGSGNAVNAKSNFSAVATRLCETLFLSHGIATDFANYFKDRIHPLASQITGVEAVDHPTKGASFARAWKFLRKQVSYHAAGRSMTTAGAIIVATAFLITPVLAADIPAGQRLALTWCSGCHIVDTGLRKSGNDAVPSFASIAQRTSTTERTLAALLSRSHRRMPDYSLSRSEIRNVSAYILSLRK